MKINNKEIAKNRCTNEPELPQLEKSFKLKNPDVIVIRISFLGKYG
jgi:hypothetical protein